MISGNYHTPDKRRNSGNHYNGVVYSVLEHAVALVDYTAMREKQRLGIKLTKEDIESPERLFRLSMFAEVKRTPDVRKFTPDELIQLAEIGKAAVRDEFYSG